MRSGTPGHRDLPDPRRRTPLRPDRGTSRRQRRPRQPDHQAAGAAVRREAVRRTSRRVRLTPVGSALRDDVRAGHELIQDGIAKAMAAGREVAGVLRVGFSSPLVADAVMTAAAAFRDRHTGSDVQIRELHLSDAFGPLRAGELDVQITELPVREPDLTTGPVLVSDPRLLAVSARHPFARSATVTAEDLSRDTILVPSGAPAYLLDTLVPPRTPSGRPVHREPVLTSRQELLTLVSAGEGMAVVGAQAERYHARPDIAYVPIAGLPPIEYAPIWPAGRETAALRTFLRTLRGKPAGQDVAVLRPPAALAWRCPGSCR